MSKDYKMLIFFFFKIGLFFFMFNINRASHAFNQDILQYQHQFKSVQQQDNNNKEVFSTPYEGEVMMNTRERCSSRFFEQTILAKG